jgi:hypothetical protein
VAIQAKQADDETPHYRALRVSWRTICRDGELLQEFDGRGGERKSEGVPTSDRRSQREAAHAAGMSKDREVIAVWVAKISAVDFERSSRATIRRRLPRSRNADGGGLAELARYAAIAALSV